MTYYGLVPSVSPQGMFLWLTQRALSLNYSKMDAPFGAANLLQQVTHSTLALRMVFLNDSKTERWTMGIRMGLKSAPIRLKDSPKYIH